MDIGKGTKAAVSYKLFGPYFSVVTILASSRHKEFQEYICFPVTKQLTHYSGPVYRISRYHKEAKQFGE